MDFQTAITEVVAITKRREKVAVIRHSINRAIADLVRHDTFSFDLKQYDYTVPSVNASSAVHFVPYSGFAGGTPRRIESLITDNDIAPYVEIKPKNAVSQGRERSGVFYKRSDGLFIKVRRAATQIRISYYAKAPTLVADTDTHWALEQAFSAIVARACQYTFATVGEDKDAARYERSSAVDFLRIQQDLE